MNCRFIVPATLIVVAFGFIGDRVGWFVGASRTPAVDSLVPIMIALLCGLSYGLLDKKSLMEKLTGRPEPEPPREAASSGVQPIKVREPIQLWPAVLWVVAVAVFAIYCKRGAMAGFDFRSPTYNSVSDIIGRDKLTSEEYARATCIVLRLRALSVPPNQVDSIIKETIGTSISEAAKKQTDPEKRKESMDRDIKELWDTFKQLEIPAGVNGLGPMNTSPSAKE